MAAVVAGSARHNPCAGMLNNIANAYLHSYLSHALMAAGAAGIARHQSKRVYPWAFSKSAPRLSPEEPSSSEPLREAQSHSPRILDNNSIAWVHSTMSRTPHAYWTESLSRGSTLAMTNLQPDVTLGLIKQKQHMTIDRNFLTKSITSHLP